MSRLRDHAHLQALSNKRMWRLLDTDSLCVLSSFLWEDRDEALIPEIKASKSAYERYVKETDNLFANEKLQKYDSMTLGKLKVEFNSRKSVFVVNKVFLV